MTPEEMEQKAAFLQSLMASLDKLCAVAYGERVAITLIIAPFESEPEAPADYVSNAETGDMLTALRNMVNRLAMRVAANETKQ